MNRKKVWRLLFMSFRIAGVDKFFYSFIVFFIVMAVVLRFAEPSIITFGDSLWYCFAVVTTVGFGDIAAVTPAGRILTLILSLFSIVTMAVFTAVIASFFLDLGKAKASDSAKGFIDDLEHLPELSKEELEQLSSRVKTFLDHDS